MKSPIILRIFKGEQLIEVKQFDTDQIVFGHNNEVTVNLSDSAVAPIHALIELRDSGYYICDLGSQSGTFRNNNQILDEPINSGDEIKIGPFKIAFFVGVPKPKGAPAPAPTTKPSEASATPRLEDKPAAKVLEKVPDAPPAPEREAKAEPKKSTAPKSAAKIPASSPIVEKSSGHNASEAAVVSKPALGEKAAQYLSQKDGKKNKKTFAPPSEIKDLRKHLKPQKGPLTEVIVAWKERIIGTYHFGQTGAVRVGSSEKNEIVLPKGIAPDSFHLIDLGPSLQVSINPQMSVELIGNNNNVQSYDELMGKGRISNSGRSAKIRVEQGEMLKIGLYENTVQIFIRYAPAAGQVALAPALELTASELTGLFVAFLLVSLMGLYVSIYGTADAVPEEEERIATVVFEKKERPKPPPEPPEKEEPKPPPAPTPPPKPTPPKKIEVTDKKMEQKPAPAASNSGRAAEVRPIPNKVDRPKKFTSAVPKGGAVKMSNTNSSGAQAKDVKKTGLLAAFGGGGMREKMDQSQTGSEGLLGTASGATGTSGMNENRAGSDVGSKFKDTGAGGKGTATQGIAGIGTQGRSSGQGTYGSGTGLGDKGNVNITAGGVGEDWTGSIDREGVRRVVRANKVEISGCYNRELNKGTRSFEGKVILKWEIGEQGRVLSAEKVSSTLGNDEVVNCLIARLKTWRFPEPPKNTVAVVTFPFSFVTQGN